MRSSSRTLPLPSAARVALAAVFALLTLHPTAAAPAGAAPTAGTPTWQTETVYARGGRVVALDAQGDDVHLAFIDETEALVRYARLGRAGWDWEVAALSGPHAADAVTGPSVGIDIAADPAQFAHVVYGVGSTVYYAVGTPDGFHTQSLGLGFHPQVALTEVGPILTYIPSNAGYVPYTVVALTPEGDGWRREAAFVHDTWIHWQTLVLDRYDRPHLAVTIGGDSQSQLYYVTRAGAEWTRTLVGHGWNPAIAADSAGSPHLAYSDEAGRIDYARWTGTAWVTETVAPVIAQPPGSGAQFVFPSLAIGYGDVPHIAFADSEGYKHAYRDHDGWHVSLIEWGRSRPSGSLIELAVDWQGRVHAAYQNTPYDNQVYARLSDGWRTEVVDERAPAAYISLDVSLAGRPRLSYAALGGSQPGLHYAAFSDFGCDSPACQNAWDRKPVALGSSADRGYYSSLALAGLPDGEPRIASYNPVTRDLEYSFRTGSAWQTETVDSNGDVGQHADLELDELGRPWIAYWDNTNYQVRLAWKDPAGWHLAANTAGPSLNAESGRLSLAVSQVYREWCCAYITYYDGAEDDLRLATWDGAAWTDVLLAAGGDVGRLNALAFSQPLATGSARLWSLLYDAGTASLQVADLTTEPPYAYHTVVSGLDGLRDLSELVLLDAIDGMLAVAYAETGDSAVRVAHGDPTDGLPWRVSTIEAGGSLPRGHVSLDRGGTRLYAAYAGPQGQLMFAASMGMALYEYNPLQPCRLEAAEAARALAAGEYAFTVLPPAQAAAAGDLDLLGAARDLFAANHNGQHYLNLYYTHASETGRLALADPTLARDAYELVQDYLPGVAALVSGEGGRVVISQPLIDRTNDLADRLAAAGSPALAAAIAAERARYNQLQDFAGLSFAEAAARLGIPVPSRHYLPVIAH